MEQKQKQIPYIAFESALARLERANRRLFILCVTLAIMLLVTNGCWIYYEQQFEDVVVTQDVKSDGDSDMQLQNIGGDYYGGDTKANDQNP
jgi:cell division septal protein FtsQ